MRYTAVGNHTMRSASMLTGVLNISLLLFLAPTIYGQYRHGDVRLVGGSYQWEGRVEIYLSGTWGTITDSDWSRDDAQVVCRKLGHYKPGATSHSGAYFGEGRGTIHWDSVQCSGSEYSLTDCNAENTGTRTSHSFDVGVKCQPADGSYREGDIRLVGGSYNWEGRVEIYWSGAWGTISDSTWTIPDAVVVCRQLAHSEVGGYLAHYGEGSGAVSIRDVTCTGMEHNITSCDYDNATADGSHSDDVGVQCQQGDGAKEGDIRLVGGTVSWQGRVEIYLSGVWGTIVYNSATSIDAEVVCRQLGYNTYNVDYLCCAGFGQGSGPILVDDLDCYGSEYRLSDCQYHNNTDGYTHNNDWGVYCFTDGPESGDVRLTSTYYGSVQVFLSGSWVYVTTTDYPWTAENARVVCRELGYLTTDPTVRSAGYYSTAPENGVKVNNVVCNGSEPRLLNCPHENLINLGDYAAAAMECQQATNCTTWDVRLAGGEDEMEGRVEMCSSYRWETVCGSQWTHNHTAVVCRHLGFSDEEGDSSFFTSEMFGEGTGPVLMDFVNCTGSEPRLNSCPHFTHYYGCSHSDDVGVHCQPAHCADGQIKLIEGSSGRYGRVEICFNQRWGTIADGFWDNTDCRVACQELGYDSRSYHCSSRYGRGGGPIHRTDFQCTGSEQRLSQCSNSNDTLLKSHNEDVGIYCYESRCVDGEVRLVEGESAWEGRLEVCFSQRWGTVSSDGWSHTNTRVVCNDLGYDFTDEVNMSIPQSLSKPVFLHNVVCSKTDLNLLECSFSKYTGNINRVQDAIVNCELPTCSDGDLKLVGGDSEREGRLEVCFDQRWGTVNADGWTDTDTQVACRQLGYSTSDVSFSIRQRKIVSSPSLPVHMTLVGCYSSDEKLTDCAYHEYTSSGNHHMDISVDCGSSTTESELNAVTAASLSIAVICILAVFVVVVVILVIFFMRRKKEKYNNRNQRNRTLGMTERTTRNTDTNERYSGNINYFNQQVSKSTDDKQTAEVDIPLDNYEEMEPEYSPPLVVQTATKQQTGPKPAAKKPIAAPSTKIRYTRNRQDPRQPAKKPPAPAPAMVVPQKVQPRYQPPSRSPSPEAIYEVPD